MTTRTVLSSAVLLALSTCMLAACGGGGSNGMLRPETFRGPPPTPETGPCPSGGTADCVVDVPDNTSAEMTGSRDSDHALIKRGDGNLNLGNMQVSDDNFRFGGGITVEGGQLFVTGTTLLANLVVQPTGYLGLGTTTTGNLSNHGQTELAGFVKLIGDVANDGTLRLSATVVGDLVNDGVLEPEASIEGDLMVDRVEGNFRQTSNGTLDAVIPVAPAVGVLTGGFLSVTGRADIDGTLQLVRFTDYGGSYALPGTPVSVEVLHADGGVFGQFAQWTSPGLLITGALRYLTNDVYFDATAISAAPAMSAVGADPLTVQSAAHFDAALNNLAKAVTVPGTTALSTTQRQFLSSVGTIQHLQDYSQATRTFDSLSGHGYADAADSLLQQAATPSAELMNRVGNLRAGLAAGAWSTQSSMLASGGSTFSGQRGGFDQWFGERLLLGSSFGWSDGSLRFDRSGGSARDESPQWDVYLRRNGSGNTYVFGDVGYSRHQLDFNRQIDLGLRRQTAGTRQSFDVMRAWVETGRDYKVGSTRLTPFGAMSYAVLHGAGFAEQGSTGFELIAQPSTYQRLNAVAGLRLGTDWRSHSRWTSLNLTAGVRQSLLARNDARAAFAGAPDASFALDGMPSQRNTGWLQMSLATGGAHWNWLLNYDRQASDQAVSLGANFKF